MSNKKPRNAGFSFIKMECRRQNPSVADCLTAAGFAVVVVAVVVIDLPRAG